MRWNTVVKKVNELEDKDKHFSRIEGEKRRLHLMRKSRREEIELLTLKAHIYEIGFSERMKKTEIGGEII